MTEPFQQKATGYAQNVNMTAATRPGFVQSPHFQTPKELDGLHQAAAEVGDDIRPHETGSAEPSLPQIQNEDSSGTELSEGSLSFSMGTDVGWPGPGNDEPSSPTTMMLRGRHNKEDCGSARNSELGLRPLAKPLEPSAPAPSLFNIGEQRLPHSYSKRNLSPSTQQIEEPKRTRTGPTGSADGKEIEEEDRHGNEDRAIGKTLEEQCEEETRGFACPYLRYDPDNNQQCLSFKLRRIRDVKQHLTRRHYHPFYCPTCYKKFPSVQDLGNHIRPQTCTPQSPVAIGNADGMTPEAQERLKERANRAAKPIEQWYSVWDILFGEEPRPPNPYLEDIFTETMKAIHRFWQAKSSEILPVVLHSQPWCYESPESIGVLLGELFKEVGTRFKQSLRPQSSVADPTLSTHVMGGPVFSHVAGGVNSTSSSGVSDASRQWPEDNPIPPIYSSPRAIEAENATSQAAESLDQEWVDDLGLGNLDLFLTENSFDLEQHLNNIPDWESTEFDFKSPQGLGGCMLCVKQW